LSKDSLTKATDALAALAKEERRSRREVVHAAEQSVRAWLNRYGQLERFEAVIERQR
jgi:16S rRNA U1498 N3-methylase RsmE